VGSETKIAAEGAGGREEEEEESVDADEDETLYFCAKRLVGGRKSGFFLGVRDCWDWSEDALAGVVSVENLLEGATVELMLPAVAVLKLLLLKLNLNPPVAAVGIVASAVVIVVPFA